MRNIKQSVAFTLTEILIVIGIIGIISALAIPNLNKSVSNQEKVTKLKKIYAELSQAHNAALIKYGPVENWFVNLPSGTSEDQRYFDRLTEFMKLTKICRNNNDGHCGLNSNHNEGESVRLLYGAWIDNALDYFGYPSAILNSGMSIQVEGISGDGVILVDIDSPQKGKNTLGIDLFEFVLTSDGIKPRGSTEWTDDNIKYCAYLGYKCAEWVIRNGNMDYIDTNHDSEDNAGVCKNGKQLSTTVPSCR